jgi:hypothetical protein
LKEQHPFLNDGNHRAIVIQLTKDFLKLKFNVNMPQVLIGHLFFGQRAFPLGGRDIGFVYGETTKYYPEIEDHSIFPGEIILIDETGNFFDIGLAEIKRDELGLYFESFVANIKIKKESPTDLSCFLSDDYFLELYFINNYGALHQVALHKFDLIQSICSEFVFKFIIFNLEKFTSPCRV